MKGDGLLPHYAPRSALQRVPSTTVPFMNEGDGNLSTRSNRTSETLSSQAMLQNHPLQQWQQPQQLYPPRHNHTWHDGPFYFASPASRSRMDPQQQYQRIMHSDVRLLTTAGLSASNPSYNDDDDDRIMEPGKSSSGHEDQHIADATNTTQPEQTHGTKESTSGAPVITTRSMWSRRHARSTEEGIRRERVAEPVMNKPPPSRQKLSALLAKAMSRAWHDSPPLSGGRRYAARTITGLIHALADEAHDVDVVVTSRRDTPFWNKHVDEIKIQFSRLGFKPLRIGGSSAAAVTATAPAAAVATGGANGHSIMSTASKVTLLSGVAVGNDSNGQSKGTTVTSVVGSATDFPTSTTDIMNGLTKPLVRSTGGLSADDVFDQIDVDKSGALDRNEIAQALNLATTTNGPTAANNNNAKHNSRSTAVLDRVASVLIQLYDFNGDGVVDRSEYKSMVEDMAVLQDQHSRRGKVDARDVKTSSQAEDYIGGSTSPGRVVHVIDSPDVIDSMAKAAGSITITDLKLDLRRLVFGAIPLLKHITPGGPLILEPFNVTINGSFNRADIMDSFLLDAGLRRLVARALRHRVGSIRDILEGALFHGRSWKMFSEKAPQVEVPKLTNVEFDLENRLIITGRARVQSQADTPVMENTFLIRTKIGTRNGGRVIRLVEPELAVVLECPRLFDETVAKFCSYFGIPKPPRPKPLYSFFSIDSPFKVEDNDGFDLGEDNRVDSVSIHDGALQFQLSAILRPGRFLGSHYVAFTVPARTFIVTLDRLREGIRAARKAKQPKLHMDGGFPPGQGRQRRNQVTIEEALDAELFRGKLPYRNGVAKAKRPQPKSFFSRFVDGYLQVDRDDSEERERVTKAIRDFFGRQANREC